MKLNFFRPSGRNVHFLEGRIKGPGRWSECRGSGRFPGSRRSGGTGTTSGTAAKPFRRVGRSSSHGTGYGGCPGR